MTGLAAILYAELVSSSSTSAQPEEGRAQTDEAPQQRLLQEAIARHGGHAEAVHVDRTLATFNSAVEAVRCAIEVQQILRTDGPIAARIGVHEAEVVFAQGGVSGHGVDVAARIQSLSLPGAILISQNVLDEVKNHPDIETCRLGAFDLEHPRLTMELHAITNDGLSVPLGKDLRGELANPSRTVAVLPLASFSMDPEDDFLADGITQELINALTHTCELQVAARTSSFAFKDRPEATQVIADTLGVAYLVEGSVQRIGGRVTVDVRLTATSNGVQLLSESYERPTDDIFRVQDEISQAIVEALANHLCDVGTGT